MNQKDQKNSGIVRAGLIFLCTLVMASNASAYYIQGVITCEGEGGLPLPGVKVHATDCSGNTLPTSGGHDTDITDENGRYGFVNFIFIDERYSSSSKSLPYFQLTLTMPDGSTYTTDCINWYKTWGKSHVANLDIAVNCDGQCHGEIGDYVWLDDGDGIQEAGEQGINGVEVRLLDASGNTLDTITTYNGGPGNHPGYYLFERLCAGSYTVFVASGVPAGYIPTVVGAPGSTSANDSDNPSGTLVTLPNDNSSNYTIDFGYIAPCTGQIGDYVWFDENQNGIQDNGEQGINDVEVLLLNTLTNITLTTITHTGPGSQPGYYLFSGLCDDIYEVSVNPATVPAGYDPTGMNQGNPDIDSDDPAGTVVTLSGTQNSDLTIDFGYTTTPTGQIGDYVWFDINQNGIQDSGESGINGVEVWLLDQDGNFLMRTTTHIGGSANQSGYYLFEGLTAGVYIVQIDAGTVPAGYQTTLINAPGSTTDNDSGDPHGTAVILLDNDSDLSIDFGYISTCLECKGGVTHLTLRYLGTVEAYIEVYDGKSVDPKELLFAGLASPGTEFSFAGSGKDSKMNSEISVWIDGDLNTKIHTSCSKPIGPGLTFGDFEIVRGYSKDGGLLCPMPDCQECDGGVTQLTLQYDGGSNARIVVYDGKDKKKDILFDSMVNAGGTFTFTGSDKDSKMSSEISVWVNGTLNTTIHTSCSKPIGPGSIFGDFLVLEGYSAKGGKLCPLPPQPDCQECDGGVTELTLQYDGDSNARIVVYDGKDKKKDVLFDSTVNAGGTFTFTGSDKDSKMSSEISVWVNGTLNTTIHTSCSKPIGPGLTFGDFLVIEGYSAKGGKLCPLPPQPDCQECDGGVTELTLQYAGGSNADIVVYDGKDKKKDVLFDSDDDPIGSDGIFTFTGSDKDSKMSSEISVWVNGKLNTTIHTSCSKPIGPGLTFGDFLVIEGYSAKGGKLCPVDQPDDNGDCGCEGKVTDLTLRYNGTSAAIISVFPKKSSDTVFYDTVGPGETFSFSGNDKNGTLGTEISVYVGNRENTAIHTSCSKPIGRGMTFGAFTVIDGHSLKGGRLCLIN